MVCFVFIDDSDLVDGNLITDYDDIVEVAESIQDIIDTWEGTLKATGGAIRPDKSFAYLLSFKFKSNGDYKYKSVAETDIELSVCNEFGERERPCN